MPNPKRIALPIPIREGANVNPRQVEGGHKSKRRCGGRTRRIFSAQYFQYNFNINMVYFGDMAKFKIGLQRIALATVMTLVLVAHCHCQEEERVRNFDTVRTSMTKVGGVLPEAIRKAQPGDIRTLERVFEINNYALVTIESYLKMLRIARTSGNETDKSVSGILNGWLKFIAYYCEYDMKYLDEAVSQTKDTAVIEILKSEKANVTSLRDASRSGTKEEAAATPKT